jgi:hypothetical protein
MIYQKNPIEKSGNISHPLPPPKKKRKRKNIEMWRVGKSKKKKNLTYV